MAWLHTWSGLLLGWVVYAIFLTGAVAYYRPELNAWMRPELPLVESRLAAAQAGVKHLREVAPDARRWILDMPDRRSDRLTVFWQPATPGARFQNAELDPVSGAPTEDTVRASYGGEFFYRFHFQLLMPHPWGRWIACIAAMFMLVALVSGVVTHRRFFADLFLFRREGRRRPWLDFHNLTAVLPLPFYVLIAYSALAIFTPMYMPWAKKFAPEAPALAGPTAGGAADAAAAAGAAAAAAAVPVPVSGEILDGILRAAADEWGDLRYARRIEVNGLAGATPTVELIRAEGAEVSLDARDKLVFDARTGERIEKAGPAAGGGERVRSFLYGFHLARFAGPVLRALFFVLGLMGAAMTATGLVLWTLKRKERLATAGASGKFGYGLVSRLNVAFVAGLPLASVAFLWSNRLLPVELAGRRDWEVRVFLIVWGLALLHACLRRGLSAWTEQLAAVGALLLALPLLDVLTAGAAVFERWALRPGLHAGFAAVVMTLGLGFWAASRRVARSRVAAVAARGTDDPVSASVGPAVEARVPKEGATSWTG